MIIITATFVLANPESRPEAVAKAIPLQQATRDGEPGCEAYVFSPDPAEENKVAVYELWEDRDSLHAHFDHENYFNMGNLIRSTSGRDSNHRKFRCDVSEPVYDENRRARADFFTLEQ